MEKVSPSRDEGGVLRQLLVAKDGLLGLSEALPPVLLVLLEEGAGGLVGGLADKLIWLLHFNLIKTS